MKTKTLTTALGVLALLTSVHRAAAQETAFTYQGRLNDGANPASGIYDLRFAIYDVASVGGALAAPLTNSATAVSNGLFTAQLDFGAGVFNGPNRWLEIAVRTNGGGAFTILSPRQQLTPTPYSIFANGTSNVLGTIPAVQLSGTIVSPQLAGTYSNALNLNNGANQFSGTFFGSGAGVSNVNAATLNGFGSGSFWNTNGNAGANPTNGAFLGTTDNLPLEFRVNNQRVMQFAYASNGFASDNPNVIGGSPVNFVAPGVVGATIAGGGRSSWTNSVRGDFGFVGGGLGNTILGYYSTIGGGQLNSAGDEYATVGGGTQNTATGNAATVSDGSGNYASGGNAAVGGGSGNNAQQSFGTVGGGVQNFVLDTFSLPIPQYGTVAGGHSNLVHGASAAIPGGEMNIADGDYSFAAGRQAAANHDGTFVWADDQGGAFGSSSSNQFLVRAAGGVGIGTTNPASQLDVNGVVTVASGSASAPSLTFNGDSNTGIHSPGANTVAVATGGSERLRVNSSGNVGIGTTAPATALHVRGTGDTEISVESVQGGERWTLQSSGTGTPGKIGSFQIIDRTANASRLLIDTNGNVGIGRVSAANALELEGNASKTTAGSWLANSDARLKTDIQTVTGALDKLSQVRLVSFRYSDDYRAQHPGIEDRRFLNIVAQEFQKVFPDDVKSSGERLPGHSDPILQADTYPLTIYSAAAIQELNRKVESENAALREQLKRHVTENAELKHRLDALEKIILNQKSN